MKYYLIAGEASGDLHGSNLMKGILKADPGARFRFWGGDKMAAVGGAENLAMHYEKASFMGFTEVLKNLRTIFGQIEQCKRDVAAYAPDVLVLIDYAGFNLRLARFGRERGIPTYYYIAPKVWAWKESRVKKIRRFLSSEAAARHRHPFAGFRPGQENRAQKKGILSNLPHSHARQFICCSMHLQLSRHSTTWSNRTSRRSRIWSSHMPRHRTSRRSQRKPKLRSQQRQPRSQQPSCSNYRSSLPLLRQP